ncbi:hypothetical protein MNBD_BACTEROID01-1291 [hydrothermal vent metagenome]|uniref:Uncharacterized protein n=1 Tax=hydrothermal vent metagenome TaxID=652676 RepID=A0A3B0T9M6_9ZZZZ
METVKQFEKQNQIVISTSPVGKRQSLPLNLIISLALGTLAGIAIILGLFMSANYLVNI